MPIGGKDVNLHFMPTFIIKRTLLFVTLAALAMTAAAQETALPQLRLETPSLSERFQPILPRPMAPALMPRPDFSARFEPILPDRKAPSLTDSIRFISSLTADRMPPVDFTPLRPERDPYSRDYDRAGVIANVGTGYISGSSSFHAMPALGNFGAASVAFTQPLGERMQFTAGLSGNKYHIGRDAWNAFGVFANASFKLNETFTINAFGQHYWNQQYPFPAAIAYQQGSLYGGTLGIKMSDTFGLDVGAQRYYDPYTRQWRTVPILAPTFQLMGQPISLDVGGLVYRLLDGLIGKKQRFFVDDPYKIQNINNVPAPAGFNPNSPVRIPDALR